MKKNYKKIIKKVIWKINKDDIPGLSAQFSYYLIIALFPLLIILIYVYGLYAPSLFLNLKTLNIIIPEEIYTVFSKIAVVAVEDFNTPFIPFSIIVILWAASLGSIGAIKGINKSYGITESRGYIKLRLSGLIFTIFFILSIQLALILIVAGNYFLSLIQKIIQCPNFILSFISFFRVIISIVLLTLIFSFVYKFAPSIKVKYRSVIPGSIFSSIGWIITSFIFSIYISNSSYYSNIYGSLSGIFILIVWLYLSGFIFLCGSEINAVISKEKDNRR